MTETGVKICFFAVFCAITSVILKSVRPEFSLFVRIAGSIAISGLAIALILPVITYLSALFTGNGLGEYGETVIKALGIASVTQICADICRDGGEGSVATGVEVVGRLEILLLCLPLFEKILSAVREVMSW